MPTTGRCYQLDCFTCFTAPCVVSHTKRLSAFSRQCVFLVGCLLSISLLFHCFVFVFDVKVVFPFHNEKSQGVHSVRNMWRPLLAARYKLNRCAVAFNHFSGLVLDFCRLFHCVLPHLSDSVRFVSPSQRREGSSSGH